MLSTLQSKKGVSSLKKDELLVKIIPDRIEMGRVAADDATEKIIQLLEKQDEINMIFAAAPSQNEFIADLISRPGIDWSRINAFHMDEYIGIDPEAPQAFGKFLKDRIFGKVPFKKVFYLNGMAADLEAECERYSALLKKYPVDIVCLGIGENGHIAFNDPGVADFNDDKLVKIIDLDLVSRQQQVNDKCFEFLHEVPTQALTLTIPAMLKGKYLFCIVPATNKAKAVYNTLNGEISEDCPATILRTKKNVILYLDEASSALLNIQKNGHEE
ncbi:MAG: glucosamine-6-phosphate deaminase [Porphyromonadaceae bacterium]|jgi:glucosamine-6-phosphate deaminase|nr:glucosamine-6-phosphate deaminase [Porphyromonadaceae bacterium]